MNSLRHRVLLVGPLPDPVTGQSIAFQQVCENLRLPTYIINTSISSSRLLNTISTIIRIFFVFLCIDFRTVYFTCSRTRMGSVKDLILLLFCRLFNKSVVNHLHGADFNDFVKNSGFLKSAVISGYKGVTSSIVLLEEMKDQFKLFPQMKIFTVSNSYANIFNLEVSVENKPLTISYLSNIMATKGIIEFLLAAEVVLSRNEEVNYQIAGAFLADSEVNAYDIENQFSSELSRLQERFGKDRINYVGTVSGSAKVNFFVNSSIFVLPTYYKTEASPIALIEAMRTGNAIISTKHNYIPAIVSGKSGLLVNTRSVLELVDAQQHLLTNVQLLLRMQHYNIGFAKREFSQKAFMERIENILECI